jgi:hypothetical protein
MKKLIIKILFRILKLPIPVKPIDQIRMKEWIGLQYPLKEFRDYIASRNLHILQILAEGTSRNEDYWINVGQRIELGRLLTEAKRNFELSEKKKK